MLYYNITGGKQQKAEPRKKSKAKEIKEKTQKISRK